LYATLLCALSLSMDYPNATMKRDLASILLYGIEELWSTIYIAGMASTTL
jgi:hypothetical protein